MKSVKTQIGDPIILELIKKFLKGYSAPGSKAGVSQSDLLSPMLINIVLLSLDKYMEASAKAAISSSKGLEQHYIRYADEFIVFVKGSFKGVNFVRNNIIDFLRTNCGLELDTDKSAIFNLAFDK